jgi:hypothetical protein
VGSQASTAVLGSLGLAGLAVFVPALWVWTQWFSTFVHEGGHALVALLTGRYLEALTIFASGNGCTSSYGGNASFIVKLAAGYSAPPAAGLGLLAALDRGIEARTILLVAIFIVVLLLVVTANAFGVFVVLTTIAILAVLLHLAGPTAQASAVVAAACFLLLAGLRDSVELYRISRGGGSNDASVLADRTGIPTVVWVSAFAAFAVYAVYQSGRWLLIDPSGFIP